MSAEAFTRACPKCKSKHLYVVVKVWARLYQHGEDGDELETYTDHDNKQIGHDHEWDDESTMQCGDCRFNALACEFEEAQ